MEIRTTEPMNVQPTDPIGFAISELERYRALSEHRPPQSADPRAGRHDDPTVDIKIGLFTDLLPERVVPEDPFDDAICIQIREGHGFIAGANPRSCLLAVYRLLRELGCRFLRPGPDGERVPPIDWAKADIDVDETPSYRHRGVCIEGSVSLEVLRAIIDWLPKNGLNAYFIQFREAFTFFDRWYGNTDPRHPRRERKDIEEIRGLVAAGIAEIERRGLIYHAVGHGWTCEPFGIPGLSWEPVDDATLPPGVSQYFAEIDGKRELFHGIPLNTNLCYGNDQVRARMAEAITTYADEHPEVDLLHVWLADGSNNQCTCDLCRPMRPSDWYVRLLNETDALLTEAGLKTRIVFLAYVDLLWPPEKEKLANPDRFVLMFAPITRGYRTAFRVVPNQKVPELPPFVLNKLVFPKEPIANLAFLQNWQKTVEPAVLDAFSFDYHLMWDHFREAGYERISAVLHEDIVNLVDLGLNGFISCQLQRVFFPTPLAMQTLAGTLWDRESDFETLADNVYRDTFGEGWSQVRAALQKISGALDMLREPDVIGRILAWPAAFAADPQAALAQPPLESGSAWGTNLLRAIEPAEELAGLAARRRSEEDDNAMCRTSWELLAIFADYLPRLVRTFTALGEGRPADALAEFDESVGRLYAQEPLLLHTFDIDYLSRYENGRWVNSCRKGLAQLEQTE